MSRCSSKQLELSISDKTTSVIKVLVNKSIAIFSLANKSILSKECMEHVLSLKRIQSFILKLCDLHVTFLIKKARYQFLKQFENLDY